MSFAQGQHHQEQRVKVVAGYALQQRLGSGSFATVYKGIRVKQLAQQPVCDEDENDSSSSSHQRQDRQGQKEDAANSQQKRSPPSTVAIKAIARTSEKLTKKVLQNLEIEISILRTYRHPNIVCMHDVQKTDRHFYLLLEYCGGGDVQHLIRSRQKGRLSERLTRRLMRDLASGLRFLWGQELIHRDIKPQNLLLTGPLPMEELAENPPIASSTGNSNMSQSIHDDPNLGFSLKIADFGFARHLQTASLAETLCGSPLYMAPEILQHHRYDAKADLWSVGTVLFEMIAGRPPFNGENHIDLLRNIQRKAVRLPPDVRVSKACVNLLRLLLNRNPLSRAGFKEFFEACDAFVALGCGGVATGANEGGVGNNGNTSIAGNTTGTGSNRIVKDLGTIHENDHVGTKNPSSESLMTVATTAEQQQHGTVSQNNSQQRIETANTRINANTTNTQQRQQQAQTQSANVVSPILAPSATPSALIPNSINMHSNIASVRPQPSYQAPNIRNRLAPLTSSPPTSLRPVLYPSSHGRVPPLLPSPTAISTNTQQQLQQQQQQMQQPGVGYYSSSTTGLIQANSVSQSQASVNDDSGFVMVEHSKSPTSSQHYYATSSQPYRGTNSNNEIVEQRARVSKGMLSTSPGTGKMLLGMVGRATIGFGVGGGGGANNKINASSPRQSQNINKHQQIEQSSRTAKLSDEIAAINKMIATAEDVGRRAVSVAHLGDSRAYLGMRLIFKTNEEGSSLLSSTPMEGVEEEPGPGESTSGNSADNSHDFSSDNSSSTEIMTSTRRRSSTSASAEVKQMIAEECLEDEMPFAISPDAPSVSLPSRSNPSVYHRSTGISSMKKSSSMSASPQNIRFRFGEALSCYLKSLKMLKGAVGAAQRVTKDLQDIEERIGQHNDHPHQTDVPKMKQRCEITSNWLCSQFRGVLERADAAKMEISKLADTSINNIDTYGNKDRSHTPNVVSVEELIYNHALASGRDGAVKQLLGQYEAARSCYRSAGLLAETLLMEVNVGADDRKILESYVDGFAARITELDQLMLQQSRMAISSNTSQSQSQSRRGSGIVGLIGPPSTSTTTSSPFVVGSPR